MAASLALANAGVPMFGLVTASTVVSRLPHANFNKFVIIYVANNKKFLIAR